MLVRVFWVVDESCKVQHQRKHSTRGRRLLARQCMLSCSRPRIKLLSTSPQAETCLCMRAGVQVHRNASTKPAAAAPPIGQWHLHEYEAAVSAGGVVVSRPSPNDVADHAMVPPSMVCCHPEHFTLELILTAARPHGRGCEPPRQFQWMHHLYRKRIKVTKT